MPIFGNGDGTFEAGFPQVVFAVEGNDPRDLDVADVNDDGADDIVTTNSEDFDIFGIVVYLGQRGTRNLSRVSANFVVPEFARAMTMADFDDDGLLDILVVGVEEIPAMLFGFGTGEFTDPAVRRGSRAVTQSTSKRVISTTMGCPISWRF